MTAPTVSSSGPRFSKATAPKTVEGIEKYRGGVRGGRAGVPADALGSRLDRIKTWLDENCGANGWALKKAALEQSASDAARPLAWVRETYEPKPISIIGTERQQTVQSHVSGVLALPMIAGLYERAARKLVSSRTKWEHTDGC